MDLPKSRRPPCHGTKFSENTSKRLKTSAFPEAKAGKFKYNFIPSLEHIARINVILPAWNHPSIRSSMRNLFNIDVNRRIIEISYWRKIEIEVIERIEQLPLPKSVIESLMCHTSDVGKEIIGWIMYYEKKILSRIQESDPLTILNHLDNLVWTPRGTIHHVKTAQSIMNNEEISAMEKYMVACTFCLEEEIFIYARNRSMAIIKSNYESAHVKRSLPMLWFWTHCAEGRLNELCKKETQFTVYESIYDCLIDLISYSGKSISGESDAAIKYIWCKLTQREKEKLIKPILKICSAECCCFLLSHTSRFLEQKILKKRSHYILKLFIENHLWVDEIVPMVHYTFQYFNEESYSEIMKLLQRYLKYYRKKITSCLFMYNKYAEILEEMWILSPPNYKNEIFERDDHLGAEIIYALAWEHSERLIRLIFSGITPAQRKDVMESKHGVKKCTHFISTNQKRSFDEFSCLAFTQEYELNAFKKSLMRTQSSQIFSVIRKERGWRGVIDFLTWFCNLPQINADELWHNIDVTFENYFDDNVKKIENKAHILACYFSDEDEAVADSASEKEKKFAKFEELMKWYLGLSEIHHERVLEDRCNHLETLVYFSLKENNFNLVSRVLTLSSFFPQNYFSGIRHKKLFSMSTALFRNKTLIFDFILRKDEFKSLENCQRLHFPNTEEKIVDCKFWNVDFFTELLKLSDYELVNDYISWLKLSDEQILKLKCDLLYEGAMCEVAKTYFENEINEFEFLRKSRRLIDWINPTRVMISGFNYDMNQEECILKFSNLLNQYRREEPPRI
ncbi:uncharacterized protein LOC135831665 [Planococcus citri]|uniref:uncharacterized protein LOC135831665 n=1 Tax=Planococcus citri TaxID=170843 RepID=UPI0031F740D3